jgi:hypothetical protein
VEYASAPERLPKGLARHPVPIMLLAHLASRLRGKEKAGHSRMRYCVRFRLRISQDSRFCGSRQRRRGKIFYEHFGFTPLPSDPYHLFRLLKDIRGGR